MFLKLFYLFTLSVVYSSCSKPDENFQEPILKESYLKEIEYLALGDSYTVGESVSFGESFPALLSASIEKNNNVKVNTTVIAQTGWRTDQLLLALGRHEAVSYDLVTLLIGVNNQFQSRPFSKYESELTELLIEAIRLAGNDPNKVFVLSIPDYYYTPFGETNGSSEISVEIDQYNTFASSIARAKGATFLNITPITRQGLEQPELVANDGLHPSGKAYEKFVDLLYPLVRSRLKD